LIRDLIGQLKAWSNCPIENEYERDELFAKIDSYYQKISQTRFSFSPLEEHKYVARFQRMKEYDKHAMRTMLPSYPDQDPGDKLTGATLATQLPEVTSSQSTQGDVEAEQASPDGSRFPPSLA
jgi:hypothetical protein